ncbi:MAG: serine hydrolase domain-containing protein [Gemmatimonadaceae bacterium]
MIIRDGVTYRIGSVAKQFTAALVLKLVDRGKLSLTDSVGRYLKGLRPEWNSITIEQLLNHTSGLARDYMQVGRAARRSVARLAVIWNSGQSTVLRAMPQTLLTTDTIRSSASLEQFVPPPLGS